MQYNKKWYQEQTQQQDNIFFPTCTIVYPCLYLMEVTEVKQIPENVCNINQARKYIQRRNICITDYHHDLSLTQ